MYVENAAEAIALAATDERAANRIYNIEDAEAPTELEWVKRWRKGCDTLCVGSSPTRHSRLI
jgi:nucleoside-diphosphate-sugar epimerase